MLQSTARPWPWARRQHQAWGARRVHTQWLWRGRRLDQRVRPLPAPTRTCRPGRANGTLNRRTGSAVVRVTERAALGRHHPTTAHAPRADTHHAPVRSRGSLSRTHMHVRAHTNTHPPTTLPLVDCFVPRNRTLVCPFPPHPLPLFLPLAFALRPVLRLALLVFFVWHPRHHRSNQIKPPRIQRTGRPGAVVVGLRGRGSRGGTTRRWCVQRVVVMGWCSMRARASCTILAACVDRAMNTDTTARRAHVCVPVYK